MILDEELRKGSLKKRQGSKVRKMECVKKIVLANYWRSPVIRFEWVARGLPKRKKSLRAKKKDGSKYRIFHREINFNHPSTNPGNCSPIQHIEASIKQVSHPPKDRN